MASVKEYSIEEDWHLESSVMKTHQKHPRGNSLIRQYMAEEYRDPKDFESFLYLSQVQQALGMKVAFEAHRSAMPFCMGSLYWQFNDCWPVASWSGIDYYGRWKALHYQAKRSFEHLAVFVEQTENKLSVNIVSDLLNKSSLQLNQQLMTFDGSVLWSDQQIVEIDGLTSKIIVSHEVTELLDNIISSDVVFVASVVDESSKALVSEAFHYFVPTKDLTLKTPSYRVTSTKSDESIEFVIQADTLVRQVHLTMNDNLNNFTDNFFDLLPGVKKHISLPTDKANSVSANQAIESLKVMSVVDTYSN